MNKVQAIHDANEASLNDLWYYSREILKLQDVDAIRLRDEQGGYTRHLGINLESIQVMRAFLDDMESKLS